VKSEIRRQKSRRGIGKKRFAEESRRGCEDGAFFGERRQ
jgi:hypothetical protein